jgi:hypothetical protein
MNLQDLIQRVRKSIQSEQDVPNEALLGFLRVLEDVRLEEIPCDEVFARLDEYVEKQVHGQDAAMLMPLLREHLDICSDCCEEYEALLTVLEQSTTGE